MCFLRVNGYFQVVNEKVATAFNMKKHGVAIIRPAIQERVTYLPGSVTKEALISFLEDYGSPLLVDYNEDTSMIVFDDKQRWHAMLFLPDANQDLIQIHNTNILLNRVCNKYKFCNIHKLLCIVHILILNRQNYTQLRGD